ncbi:MAG: RNA polymerase sigma factor [Verrucomicrobiales bacterium]|nr:RNA polymerase sigma factor [Verrucomicrobiales bacterium]
MATNEDFHRPEAAGAGFHTTHWSVVLAVRDQNNPLAHQALSALCEAYWYPLYAFVRRQGKSPGDAEDLTQSFFARLLEKKVLDTVNPEGGRFRSFLLSSLKNFLANEWDRVKAQKRGGDKVILSLDEELAESRYEVEPADSATPESLFEKRWAMTLLDQVLVQLRREFVAGEKADHFDALKAFLSSPDPKECSYAEAAGRTGLKEATVRVAVHRLRRRYGELLRAEIANTVASPDDVEDELRHLVRVLAG